MARYVEAEEFLAGSLPVTCFSGIETSTIEGALDRASSVVDSYLRKRHKLPLTVWGGDVKDAVMALAAHKLMKSRGYSASARSDTVILEDRNDAKKWLKEVALGLCEIEGQDSTPELDEASPVVTPATSNRARLWTRSRC
jgi:phage gp36-like protein